MSTCVLSFPSLMLVPSLLRRFSQTGCKLNIVSFWLFISFKRTEKTRLFSLPRQFRFADSPLPSLLPFFSSSSHQPRDYTFDACKTQITAGQNTSTFPILCYPSPVVREGRRFDADFSSTRRLFVFSFPPGMLAQVSLYRGI